MCLPKLVLKLTILLLNKRVVSIDSLIIELFKHGHLLIATAFPRHHVATQQGNYLRVSHHLVVVGVHLV